MVVKSELLRKRKLASAPSIAFSVFGCSKPLEPDYYASSSTTKKCNYEESKEESTDEIEANKFQLFHWKKKKDKRMGKL